MKMRVEYITALKRKEMMQLVEKTEKKLNAIEQSVESGRLKQKDK